jgi:tetratricopeptide (TPR) repeat protein
LADRHAYVAMVGILVAVTWGAADLLSRRAAAGVALTGGAVAALALATAQQVTVWRNSVTMSARALETAPTTAFVHYALGTALLRESPPDMAGGLNHLTTAVRLDPDDRFAMTNLGIALGQAGMPESGLDYIAKVLQRSPNDARARIAMGRLLLDLGRPDEAIGWLRGGLELVPADREAYVNLGVALNRVRRFDDTIAYITRSSASQRQIPEARFNLGVAYASTGRTSEALAEVGALRSIAPELAASLATFVDSARFGEPSPR